MADGSVSVEVNVAAQRVMTRMAERCQAVKARFGTDSAEYRETIESFAYALLSVLRLGGRIYEDVAPLSLYGHSFIDYGVIWHSDHKTDLTGSWSTHS